MKSFLMGVACVGVACLGGVAMAGEPGALKVVMEAVGADGVPTIIELVAPAETVVVHYR